MVENTSYNEIWKTFLNNCKVSDIDLPQTDEQRYEVIKNAVLHFNNRLREDVKCDDSTEMVDRKLNGDHLLILAHYIRWSFLINQKTFLESLFQPFSHDVGIRNFKSQMDSLEKSIEKEEEIIEKLILNMAVDFL